LHAGTVGLHWHDCICPYIAHAWRRRRRGEKCCTRWVSTHIRVDGCAYAVADRAAPGSHHRRKLVVCKRRQLRRRGSRPRFSASFATRKRTTTMDASGSSCRSSTSWYDTVHRPSASIDEADGTLSSLGSGFRDLRVTRSDGPGASCPLFAAPSGPTALGWPTGRTRW